MRYKGLIFVCGLFCHKGVDGILTDDLCPGDEQAWSWNSGECHSWGRLLRRGYVRRTPGQ